jgi:predicted RNase H-like HicB family nuclease
MRPYIALIHKEPDSCFGVSFPDLPGCISAGDTLDEARVMAAEALALHLDGLAEDGEVTPEPSTLEVIMKDALNRDAVAVLVDPPKANTRALRLNITLPDDLVEQIDRHAEANGMTRSGFLATAARSALVRRTTV